LVCRRIFGSRRLVRNEKLHDVEAALVVAFLPANRNCGAAHLLLEERFEDRISDLEREHGEVSSFTRDHLLRRPALGDDGFVALVQALAAFRDAGVFRVVFVAELPFFLYLPFNAPHDPFQGPNDRDSADDQVLTRETYRTREKYRQMVESLDANVGKVIAHLKKTGLSDNTIVFFMSDNGGLPVVARNAPFSGFKTELWEGGIRTKLLAWGPGRIEGGRTVDSPVVGMDLFPTAIDLAEATVPEGRPVDGGSLAPILHGTSTGREPRTLFFRYQAPGAAVQRAAVQDPWKYLRDEDGNEYLFDLDEDVAEKNDLAQRQPERFAALRSAWEAWEEEVMEGAPKLPKRN